MSAAPRLAASPSNAPAATGATDASPAARGLSPGAARAVLAFRDARGWGRRHNPKDLAVSIAVEAGELLECFQWAREDDLGPVRREAAAAELADVLSYCVLMADALGLDLSEVLTAKLQTLEAKYPAGEGSRAGWLAARAASRAAEAERLARDALFDAPETARILGFRAFLAANTVGRWTSASDNRVYFVAYAREAVNFWSDVEALCRRASRGTLEAALPADFPERPDAAQVDALTKAGLLALLHRIVRTEHVRDGAFLSAAESGLLARVLGRLAGLLE